MPDLSLAIIEDLRLTPNLLLARTKALDDSADTRLRRGAWDPAWTADAFGTSFPASIVRDDARSTVIHFRMAVW